MEHVEQFIKYFSGEIDEICTLKNRIAKKVLYTSIIDTLGRIRFPSSRNHERIVSFIDLFSDWQDKSRVSLPQLILNLECVLTESEKKLSKLYSFGQEQLKTWQKGRIYRSDKDLELSQIINLKSSREDKAIKYATYKELFYSYRNKMVHEFREPGYGMELSDDGNSTYYHSYLDHSWQLVFPVGVFENICLSCLKNFKQYLLTNNINPYEKFEFGEMWTEKRQLEPNSLKK